MNTIFPGTIELFAQSIPGEVDQMITPTQPGRVRALASIWYARLYETESQVTLLPGDRVRVVGRQGIMLLVVPSR